MKSGDITGVTGVPELTWCYNRNKDRHHTKTIMPSQPGLIN